MLSSHPCFCLLTRLVLHHVALCGGRGPLLLGSVSKESLLSVVIGLCAITWFCWNMPSPCFGESFIFCIRFEGFIHKRNHLLFTSKQFNEELSYFQYTKRNRNSNIKGKAKIVLFIFKFFKIFFYVYRWHFKIFWQFFSRSQNNNNFPHSLLKLLWLPFLWSLPNTQARQGLPIVKNSTYFRRN